nr:DNA/RNA non-specific endonuclease [Psychrobacter arenosus]
MVKTDNGFIYRTDRNSRVTSVEADLSLDTNARNGYQQRVLGSKDRLDDDHGGHLIASMFGGPGEGINIVAMNAKFNGSSGACYKMEQVWQKALDSNKSVKVKIEPIYSSNSKRPDSFDITQVIGGKTSDKINLKNTETGK